MIEQSIEEIINTVCESLEVDKEILQGRCSKGEIVDARCIAINLIRENHKITLVKTGLLFSGLDHSTVKYYEDRHSDLYYEKKYNNKFKTVMAAVKQAVN